MKVIVATKNFGKIEGAKRALSHYFKNFEIEGLPVPSDVGEQPLNEEILLGAKNRIKNLKKHCKQNNIKADLYMSIESGINNLFGDWFITNYAVIEDNNNFSSSSTSASLPVPQKYVNEIISTDLSLVMDRLFSEDAERHNYGGGVQLLTKSVVSRIDLTEQAFVMALTKYLNKNWN